MYLKLELIIKIIIIINFLNYYTVNFLLMKEFHYPLHFFFIVINFLNY